MSIRVSKRFRQEAEASHIPLAELAFLFKGITPESLEADPRIHRLAGTSEDIYVFRHKDLRIFLTKIADDVILISLTSRG